MKAKLKNERKNILYRKWVWGTAGGTEYDLIYDESDHIAVTGYEPSSKDPCSRTVLKLKSHFYVTQDFCP
jgi:hypothetical protein